MRFADGLERKIDMTKMNVNSLKPWIVQILTALLGIKEDVVKFVYNELDERYSDDTGMQINMTVFPNGKNARTFLSELWGLLCRECNRSIQSVSGTETK